MSDPIEQRRQHMAALLMDLIEVRAFKPGELQRWWVDFEPYGGMSQPRDASEIWLHVIASTDRFDRRLSSDSDPVETDRELVERIRSDLQDWIAESKFGWGELRLD